MKNYRNIALALLLIAYVTRIEAQIPTVKNQRTGRIIRLLGEELLRQGKKPADVIKAKTPVSTGTGQVIESRQFGTRTVSLLKNSATNAATEQNKVTNNGLTCYTEQREVTVNDQASQLLNPISDVLFPGSVILGSSVPSGGYTPVTAKKNPLVVYVDGLNLKHPDKNSLTVESPNGATVKRNVMTLVNQELAGPQPAILNDRMEEVKSQEDIDVVLNTHYNGFGVSVKNTFKFDKSTSSYNVLMEFTQIYFTVSVVPPVSGADFFVDSTELKNDWTYVSSVNYGRRAVLAINIYDSERVITDQFKVKIKGFLGSGGASGDIAVRNLFRNATVKGFFVGGNPTGAADVIGGTPEQALKKFNDLKKSGGVFSADSPAVPLSYTLRFLNDHSVALVAQTLKYTQRYCDEVVRYKLTLENIRCAQSNDQGDNNNPEEFFGIVDGLVQKGETDTGIIKPLQGATDRVMDIKRTKATSLLTNQLLAINNTRFYELNKKANPTAFLKMKGEVTEKDGSNHPIFDDEDDKLNNAGSRLEQSHFLSAISENAPLRGKLNFNGGGSGKNQTKAEVNYKIEIVGK